MKAYLHFAPGDTLLFNSIVPTSSGAIFGACLIFFLISVGDRYLRAACRGVERTFSQRAKRLTTAYYHFDDAADSSGGSAASHAKAPASELDKPAAAPGRFILSHELSRGALAGLQTTIHYLLMLVVMTFNAAYIVSVILGVVVGEAAFGRLNR
ncbi:Ctr copper transporter [Mycena sp. CBHHK59/15]|nr:Ctr copper transporter [Mycena sp. CBHHK59/15]